MKKIKVFGLIGIVFVIALMSASSVWAGPLNMGTVTPPVTPPEEPQKHSNVPDCAKVGVDIDPDDLPGDMLTGKVVQVDEDDFADGVKLCFEIPNGYIGFANKLVVKVKSGDGYISLPTTGMNQNGKFYRCVTVYFSGNYYLSMP